MEILRLTVTSCIHLVRSNLAELKPNSFASGVIVKYKERYFMCTVAHFVDFPDQNIGIITGRVKNNVAEIYYLGDFSYLTEIKFEDEPDAEDLEYCVANPDESGKKLDIAFKEIALLDNIYQHERIFDLNGIGKITIEEGGKTYLVVDDDYEIKKDEICSFFGRIKFDIEEEKIDYQEQLYYGLPIKNITNNFIELELGMPVSDHKRFKGCSGAPVIDTRGRLIGLVTHGEKDVTKSSVYAFRFDRVKQWIDWLYFQIPKLDE